MRSENNKTSNVEGIPMKCCSLDEMYESIKFNVNELGDMKKALCLCEEVMKVNNSFKGVDFYAAYCNDRLGNIKNAEKYYKKYLLRHPESIVTINNLAGVLSRLMKNEEALELFQKALKDIDIKQHDFFSNYLLYLNYSLNFDDECIFKEHLKYSEFLKEKNREKGFENDLNPYRKLKIGYVSNDFRLHSVTYFILSQIALHNKNEFEVHCYSDVKNPDFVTEQIKSYADNFKTINGMSNEQVSKLIENDSIDILFDLGGHLGINRLPVFAVKPVPIQITAIGYPNTTGLRNMDYRLTDSYCDPYGETNKYYTEKLIRMKKSFLCYRNYARAPRVNKVIHDNIVFCSYNNSSKLNKTTIEVWSEILKRVDNSILVLKSNIYFDDAVIEEMKEYFKIKGVESERLKLITMHPSLEEHLDSYNKIDIALDTFPYNGTTTTCEALFMGVPVITFSGKRHASRVGYSILNNLGLNDLISFDREEYIEKAVSLAKNKDKLNYLNKNLRELIVNSPIMDSISYIQELEQILRDLWIDWTNNQWTNYIKNSNSKENLLNNLHSIYDTLFELKNISCLNYDKNYSFQLLALLSKNTVEIFNILLQAGFNDSEVESLLSIINRGLEMLLKVLFIEDFNQCRKIIDEIISPVIKKISDKYKCLY